MALNVVAQQFAGGFDQAGGPAIGPIGLIEANKPDGTPLVAGLEVTGFSDVEEGQVGQTGNVPFLIESKFKELGASYVCGEPWTSKTAAAGKLLTGQNPQSSEALAALEGPRRDEYVAFFEPYRRRIAADTGGGPPEFRGPGETLAPD